MAGFRLSKPYSMCQEEVREAAQGLASRLEREHGVRSRWQGDSVVTIKGSGIDGKLSFEDGYIDVSVKLGFLASAFQGALRSEVQRYLDEHIS
jgi:putative polyhydroxyalkanoate system protein